MAGAQELMSQDRGTAVLTVTIIMLCCSTVFVTLRLISRFGVVKKVGSDDYAIILAWVGTLKRVDILRCRRSLINGIADCFWLLFCHLLWNTRWIGKA